MFPSHDRVGQTIRGLLNTHIRNRILETASPDAAVRQATGATFSKKAPVVKIKEVKGKDLAKAFEVGTEQGVLDIINKIDPNYTKLDKKGKLDIQKQMLNKLADAGIDVRDLLATRNIANAGYSLNSINKRGKNLRYISSKSILQNKIDNAKTPEIKTDLQATKKAVEKGEILVLQDVRKALPDNTKTSNKDIRRAVEAQPPRS